MRVKLGDTWFDSENQPIVIQLSPADIKNISSMDPAGRGLYCVFEEKDNDPKDISAWMQSGALP